MMLTTSFSAAFLTAWMTASHNPSLPWQPDYPTAVKRAVEEKKPLAVFIGHGKSGKDNVDAELGQGTKEAKTLAESYVSLYIDADTEAGKKLAVSFEISEGVVISNRTGDLQAVRHEGTVTKTELSDYLNRYAEPTRVVTTTEYGGRLRRPIINTIQTVTSFLSSST